VFFGVFLADESTRGHWAVDHGVVLDPCRAVPARRPESNTKSAKICRPSAVLYLLSCFYLLDGEVSSPPPPFAVRRRKLNSSHERMSSLVLAVIRSYSYRRTCNSIALCTVDSISTPPPSRAYKLQGRYCPASCPPGTTDSKMDCLVGLAHPCEHGVGGSALTKANSSKSPAYSSHRNDRALGDSCNSSAAFLVQR
jgi:hypothetical protein